MRLVRMARGSGLWDLSDLWCPQVWREQKSGPVCRCPTTGRGSQTGRTTGPSSPARSSQGGRWGELRAGGIELGVPTAICIRLICLGFICIFFLFTLKGVRVALVI